MILHFAGGLSDGTSVDTDNPGNWFGIPDGPPYPDVIEMHSARANRTAYRLERATPDEVWYRIDAKLTAEYRARAGVVR